MGQKSKTYRIFFICNLRIYIFKLKICIFNLNIKKKAGVFDFYPVGL
ncbi:hypothetical protein SAMN02745171_01072 [Porphyromonas circumdentaria]|uniref:Uncharacterized protein n=1 Tax=Porphyromonas circumdentaria TaxID=29524 RepID=A0A1T4NE61_9PORP|nr:hypothetical protein [Porphyromonas circumdentaria]SJZ77068.1 hypothetical protein SAMN02745171_01072 [Porphyromonas circumdentaria]